jgi:hypothetical protein
MPGRVHTTTAPDLVVHGTFDLRRQLDREAHGPAPSAGTEPRLTEIGPPASTAVEGPARRGRGDRPAAVQRGAWAAHAASYMASMALR